MLLIISRYEERDRGKQSSLRGEEKCRCDRRSNEDIIRIISVALLCPLSPDFFRFFWVDSILSFVFFYDSQNALGIQMEANQDHIVLSGGFWSCVILWSNKSSNNKHVPGKTWSRAAAAKY